jgi:hypothetical protein
MREDDDSARKRLGTGCDRLVGSALGVVGLSGSWMTGDVIVGGMIVGGWMIGSVEGGTLSGLRCLKVEEARSVEEADDDPLRSSSVSSFGG